MRQQGETFHTRQRCLCVTRCSHSKTCCRRIGMGMRGCHAAIAMIQRGACCCSHRWSASLHRRAGRGPGGRRTAELLHQVCGYPQCMLTWNESICSSNHIMHARSLGVEQCPTACVSWHQLQGGLRPVIWRVSQSVTRRAAHAAAAEAATWRRPGWRSRKAALLGQHSSAGPGCFRSFQVKLPPDSALQSRLK